jgi:hypothetical protein
LYSRREDKAGWQEKEGYNMCMFYMKYWYMVHFIFTEPFLSVTSPLFSPGP